MWRFQFTPKKLRMMMHLLMLLYRLGITGEDVKSLPYPHGSWTEKRLIKDLFHDYEKKARPVVDGVSPIAMLSETRSVQQVTIEFGLALIQILDLNENEQVLTTSLRTLYRWFDYHLVWDPEEYDNITHISIPTSYIWLPDISLYNYADERLEQIRVCDARVNYKGAVEWQPRAIYKSACSVHIQYFPFDQQNCTMKFGPWTYDGARTNITFYEDIDELDLSAYEASPEWKLVSTKAIFTEIRYPCCDEVYPDIKFFLVILRQPAFYNYVIILPCFLLSSLTLVLFCLPPETPAKMQLGMSMFQAFNFLLLILTKSIPSAASTFPLIGTYYCINMFLVTLSTFLCLIVVNCHFRGDSHFEVPWWLKKLAIDYAARVLFVNVPGRPVGKSEKKTKKLKRKIFADVMARASQVERTMRCSGHHINGPQTSHKPRSTKSHYREMSCGNHHCVSKVPRYCQSTCAHPECHSSCCHVTSQWRIPCHHSYCVGAGLRVEDYCQHCRWEYDQDRSYREQEPPRIGQEQNTIRSSTQKKPTLTEEYYQEGDFCPACAEASTNKIVDPTNEMLKDCMYVHSPGLSSQQEPNISDPDSAIIDVWSSAAFASKGKATKRPQSVSIKRLNQNFPDDLKRNDENLYSANRKEPGTSTPTATNIEELLIDCINQNSISGYSQGLYVDDVNEGIFGRESSGLEQCEQCDAEAAAVMTPAREWYPGHEKNLKGREVKPDIRVLRRVATVTRDIAEIVRGIRYFQKKNENKERVNKLVNEWRVVGGVLDRIFFVCYVIAISVSIILYFPRPADSQ